MTGTALPIPGSLAEPSSRSEDQVLLARFEREAGAAVAILHSCPTDTAEATAAALARAELWARYLRHCESEVQALADAGFSNALLFLRQEERDIDFAIAEFAFAFKQFRAGVPPLDPAARDKARDAYRREAAEAFTTELTKMAQTQGDAFAKWSQDLIIQDES